MNTPSDRRQKFGAMDNRTYETVMLDGKTYNLWYENAAQRQQRLNEYYRKKFGVVVENHRENRFGMM